MRKTDHNAYCISISEIPDFLKKISTHELKVEKNCITCIHVDKYPVCGFLNSGEPVTQPVLASDGFVYDQSALDAGLKCGEVRSPHTWKYLTAIFNKAYYIPVRIASRTELVSILDPRRMMKPQGGVILIGRNLNQQDDTILFLEKRLKCGDSQFEYGEITAYQFKRLDTHCIANAEIKQTHYSGNKYATVTQSCILENDFHISPKQVEGRSYPCVEEEIKKLEAKIKSDMLAVAEKSLRYIYYSNKLMVRLYDILCFFKTSHNSCSWATDVLYSSNIMFSKMIEFEQRFSIYKKNTFSELFLGAIPNQRLPKQILFTIKTKNETDFSETNQLTNKRAQYESTRT